MQEISARRWLTFQTRKCINSTFFEFDGNPEQLSKPFLCSPDLRPFFLHLGLVCSYFAIKLVKIRVSSSLHCFILRACTREHGKTFSFNTFVALHLTILCCSSLELLRAILYAITSAVDSGALCFIRLLVFHLLFRRKII